MITVIVTRPPSFELSCECHPADILNPQLYKPLTLISYNTEYEASGGSERHSDSPQVMCWWVTDPKPQEFSLIPPSWASFSSWTYLVAESSSPMGWPILCILLFRFMHWPDDLGEKMLFYCTISSSNFGKEGPIKDFIGDLREEHYQMLYIKQEEFGSPLGVGFN